MPDEEKKTRKIDERLSRVAFEEVERTRSRYLNVANLVLVILIIAGLIFLSIVYLRSCNRPPAPVEEKPPGENIWIPGIDYQPEKGEGN
ncbi:MAG: hypothetical protein ACUVUR_01085 [bacterium]